MYIFMVSTKEKESVKKLVKFIVAVTLAYLAFLQITSLVYLFSSKEKNVSQELSQEDAPFPAFTMCVRTDYLAREEVLEKYGVRNLIFDDDPEDSYSDGNSNLIKFNWKHFDWGSVSLKQLYDEAVIYPHELMNLCQVGDDYDCMQNEGVYHRWENVLKRSYSCSTLRIWKKVPYGEKTEVIRQFEGLSNIPVFNQIHETSRSVPRYINKYLDHEHEHVPSNDRNNVAYTYTVEKEEYLPENEGRSCSEDPTTDRLKCKEDCFEKQLLQDNSSCVLPWVMSPGRECSSVEEALAMMKKEKEIQIIQCDCQDYCTNVRYIHKGDLFYEAVYINKAFIDNTKGITLLQESYMYTFLDLLANCGGSLAVFFSVSLLWLLQGIIKTLCSFKYFSKSLSSNFQDRFLECVLKASSLACLSLFLYEGSQLISKYQQNPKMLTIDRIDPLQSQRPNVIICNGIVSVTETFTFTTNYIESIYSNPINHMIECHLDTETCMKDGSLFSWETFYSTMNVCSMLRFNAAARYKELEIIFDDDFQEFYSFLTSVNRIGRYTIGLNGETHSMYTNMVLSIGYSSEQKFNLPPCMEDYLQCQERCWEQEYLKEDLCSPPGMPTAVKYQPCKTASEFIDLIDYYYTVNTISSCHCGQPCSTMVMQYSVSQDVLKL